MRLWGAVLIVLIITPAFSFAARAEAPTPIQHIIIVMQENHSFDNMFGTFPGLAAGFSVPLGVCLRYSKTRTPCASPWDADSNQSEVERTGLCHSGGCSRTSYANGKMNGFVKAQAKFTPIDAMAYYTNRTLPDYWDLASYYSLDANFFSSDLEYSWPNHLYAFAGQGTDCTGYCPEQFNLNFSTMADLLTGAGYSWGYFSGGWSDSWDCNPVVLQSGQPYIDGERVRPFLQTWQVAFDFPRLQTTPGLCQNMYTLNDFAGDVSNGSLPAVSWVTPNQCCSDHPQKHASWANGQEYVAGLVDSIESNPSLWGSTAIFITWDDFGGYYDNVAPTQVDQYGYGFRVPLIVVSPYVIQGITYGPHQQDFTALLSTMEANWGLSSLTARDASVGSLMFMFNFTQSPRPPLILPTSTLATWPPASCSLCNFSSTHQIAFVPQDAPQLPCLPGQEEDPCD
jgi:phospholipase C